MLLRLLQLPGRVLAWPFSVWDLAPWIVTAGDILRTFLNIFSSEGLLQKSTLLLLHRFNSPATSQSPNYETTDNAEGSC